MNSLEEIAIEVAQKMDDVFLRNVPADVLRSYARRLVAALGAQEPYAVLQVGANPRFVDCIYRGVALPADQFLWPEETRIPRGTSIRLYAAPALGVSAQPEDGRIEEAAVPVAEVGSVQGQTIYAFLLSDVAPSVGDKLYLSPTTVPEGWQLVPKKATEEMIGAFVDNCHTTSRGGIIVRSVAYSQMLATAPSPQEDKT